MAKYRLFVIGGLLLCIVVGALSASAKDETNAPSEANIFAGKIVVVIINRSNALENSESSEVLKDPHIRELGGKFFIVGAIHRPAANDSDWRKGAEVGIEWDSVTAFYSYTPAQYEEVEKIGSEQNSE